MNHFGDGVASRGIWQTFVVLGLIYAVFMLGGAFGYRVPPTANWRPEGWKPAEQRRGMITTNNVHLSDAHKTPQFWLIWLVLMLNVSAGIGVLAVASPMLQFMFGGSLIGMAGVRLPDLSAAQTSQVAAVAAGFVGLLSLFNILGRFFWASISDRIGRKMTYATFFLLGAALYAGSPWTAQIGSVSLFVIFMCVILSMYGGGFATVPAYLADMFGTQYVGAVHGRLLTAWSTAGVVGPVAITQIPQWLQSKGVGRGEAYGQTLYILAGFLVVGFVCNLLVRPVAERFFMRETTAVPVGTPATVSGASGIGRGGITGAAVIGWAFVGIPLLWGIWITISKSIALLG